MGYNFAQAQARRNGRNIIVSMLLLIVVIGVAMYFLLPFIGNVYGKYEGFHDSQELHLLHAQKKQYVTTTAELLFDTDYVMTEDGKDKYYYFAFWSGDEMVVCRTPLSYTEWEYEDYSVRGKLREPNSDEDRLLDMLKGEIASDSGMSRSEVDMYLSPYVISLDHGRTMDQVVATAGLVAMGAAFVRLLFAIMGMMNYRTTKSYKRLAKAAVAAGGPSDSDWVNEILSAEYEGQQVYYKSPSLLVTWRWVAHLERTSYMVYPKGDLVWVHYTRTQHRTNGIPSGKSHAITLHMRDRKVISINARNEKDARRIQDELERCGLVAIFGYSAELEGLFNSNMDEFVALARRQYEQMNQPQHEAMPQQGAAMPPEGGAMEAPPAQPGAVAAPTPGAQAPQDGTGLDG